MLQSQFRGNILHFTMTPGDQNIPRAFILPDMPCETVSVGALAGGIDRQTEVARKRVDGVKGAEVGAV